MITLISQSSNWLIEFWLLIGGSWPARQEQAIHAWANGATGCELELGISIFFGESATDDIGQPAGERHQNGEPRHFYHFVHFFLRIHEILYENGCVHELSTCIVRTLQWCIALQWALFVCIFKALALPNVSSQRSRKFFFGWRPSPVTSSVHQLAVSTTSHLSDPT